MPSEEVDLLLEEGDVIQGDFAPGAGARRVPEKLTLDPEVTVYADEVTADDDPLMRRLTTDPAHGPELAGGDVDTRWDAGDVGDETVGGTMPTPDQDNVDEIGAAAGLAFEDNEPLDIDDKLGRRDAQRWELDPASAEDYEQRAREMSRKRPTSRDPKPS